MWKGKKSAISFKKRVLQNKLLILVMKCEDTSEYAEDHVEKQTDEADKRKELADEVEMR